LYFILLYTFAIQNSFRAFENIFKRHFNKYSFSLLYTFKQECQETQRERERERHYLLEYMIKIYLANNTVLVRQAEGVGVQNKLVYFDLIARHEK